MDDVRIGFIGAGNMAQALARGLVASSLKASQVRLSDPDSEKVGAFCREVGVQAAKDNQELCTWANVVFLAVKPQVALAVLRDCAPYLGDSLMISVAAGLPSATLAKPLSSGVRVVRAMPNTPALVGAGATAVCKGHGAQDEDVQLACNLLAAVGSTAVVAESQMDAVTGLSGSGPAYVLTFLEALADGAVRCGLPRDIARALSVQTVLGTAKLVAETGEHTAALRDKVTSPGGTTAAGLAALEEGNLRHTVASAVASATQRSIELGSKSGVAAVVEAASTGRLLRPPWRPGRAATQPPPPRPATVPSGKRCMRALCARTLRMMCFRTAGRGNEQQKKKGARKRAPLLAGTPSDISDTR